MGTKKLMINVRPTEDDATHSGVLNPVAQALREAVGLPRAQAPREDLKFYPGLTRYDATAGSVYMVATNGDRHIMAHTPPAVAEWLKRWNATGEGGPFTFEIATVANKPTLSEMLGWF